jgi:hypothetical protein
MTDIPHWWMRGDWFDVCSCDIACPCEFAQPPTNNRCEGVLAYQVREGAYGDVRLDGPNVLGYRAVYSAKGERRARQAETLTPAVASEGRRGPAVRASSLPASLL